MLTYDEPLLMSSQPALSGATCRYPEGGCLIIMQRINEGAMEPGVDGIAVLSFFVFVLFFSFFFQAVFR